MDATREELQALKDDIERMRADLRDLAKTAVGDVAAAEERAEGRLRQAYDAVREGGETVLRKSREQVQRRPLTTVIAAFAIGVLVGKLLDRNRS